MYKLQYTGPSTPGTAKETDLRPMQCMRPRSRYSELADAKEGAERHERKKTKISIQIHDRGTSSSAALLQISEYRVGANGYSKVSTSRCNTPPPPRSAALSFLSSRSKSQLLMVSATREIVPDNPSLLPSLLSPFPSWLLPRSSLL